MRDFQNKPITPTFEIEEREKYHQNTSGGKQCSTKKPTQQIEDMNQLADEFQTSNIQYAVSNGSILGKTHGINNN